MKLTRVAIIVFALFLLGCSTSVTEPQLAGTFNYSAFDSAGSKIVAGWFTIRFQDTITFEGGWHFKKIGAPVNIGPQVGDGRLIGGWEGKQVSIGLNPHWVDNNVFLVGEYTDNKIIGKWFWSTVAGETNRGTFLATRFF